MTIEIRTPTDDDWPAICHADARAFASSYTPEDIEALRPLHDMTRFRIAVDGTAVVAIAGSYACDVALPGETTMPMGGVTWVSVAATHRRQGLMRRVIDAIHADVDDRGEPLATLYASEGGIYEHLGYGAATKVRVTSIDRRLASVRPEFAVPNGSVHYVEGDDRFPMMEDVWERFYRSVPGELRRTTADHDHHIASRDKPMGVMHPAHYLAHADGYAVYRLQDDWNNGHPQHTMHLSELAAITPEAHLALWNTLLSMDLVGQIRSRTLSLDEPLPYLLANPRSLRTTELNDGVWVNVRDVAIAFGNRSYRTTDRIVIEADGVRWAIDGGPDGASCRSVRTKPDLVTTKAMLGSLLYGGVSPSELVAGRRMTARNADAVRRADLFFTSIPAPHCQTQY